MTRTDVPVSWDERTMLATFLEYTRATVHAKCEGVSDEHAHSTPLPTSPLMSIAAIVNHLRWGDWHWFEYVLQGADDIDPATADDPDPEMRVAVGYPLAQLLDEYETQGARYRYLETARHNGHLDILRDLADGATGR